MFENQHKDFIALLKGHFTSSTEQDCDLAWKVLRGLDLADVTQAVETHRLEKGDRAYRADIGRVKALAWTARNKRTRGDQVQADRFVSWVRSDAAGVDRADPHATNEVAVVQHFYKAWTLVQQAGQGIYGENDYGADESSIQNTRRMIYAHCRHALEDAGVKPSRAITLAREAIDLPDGEVIAKSSLRQGGPAQTLGGETLVLASTPHRALSQLAVA